MSRGYAEELQDLVAQSVADALLVLDLQPGISEETRLNFAVDLAVAETYAMAIGDVVDRLRDAQFDRAAFYVEKRLAARWRKETTS